MNSQDRIITAKVRVIARLVRGNVYVPLSKKSMVKKPLQANNSTAKIRWMTAGSGKRLPFSKMGWMEEALIVGISSLRYANYPVGFLGDCSQERHTRGRRFKNFTFPLARQAQCTNLLHAEHRSHPPMSMVVFRYNFRLHTPQCSGSMPSIKGAQSPAPFRILMEGVQRYYLSNYKLLKN